MPQTILIVEDDPTIAGLMCDLLNDHPSYRAVAVYTCAQALLVLQEIHIDGLSSM